MNPSPDTAVSVQLTFMTTEGAVPGPGASLPPASRKTFHVNDYVTGDVSTRVESDGYVVAERSMYINGRDGKAGAHNSLGLMASYVDGSGAGAAFPTVRGDIYAEVGVPGTVGSVSRPRVIPFYAPPK